MPSVDVAMARSLRPSVWEAIRNIVVRSITADLQRRDIISDAKNKVSDVQTAFSSWDNCMKAAYCKYANPSTPSSPAFAWPAPL